MAQRDHSPSAATGVADTDAQIASTAAWGLHLSLMRAWSCISCTCCCEGEFSSHAVRIVRGVYYALTVLRRLVRQRCVQHSSCVASCLRCVHCDEHRCIIRAVSCLQVRAVEAIVHVSAPGSIAAARMGVCTVRVYSIALCVRGLTDLVHSDACMQASDSACQWSACTISCPIYMQHVQHPQDCVALLRCGAGRLWLLTVHSHVIKAEYNPACSVIRLAGNMGTL